MGIEDLVKVAPFKTGIFDRVGKPVTVTRNVATFDQTTGKYSQTPTPFKIPNAVVLPFKLSSGGEHSKDLPEGVNYANLKTLYSITAIQNDDVISYGGNEYRVVKLTDIDDSGRFFKAVIERMKRLA